MYDRPTLTELVASVRDFIERTAMPKLEGHAAFHARVAVNALGIALRQLEQAPQAEAEELARLRALLGREGSLEELNRELCERNRAGELGLATPGLAEHLRATTFAKLAVDQPKYTSYVRALAARPTDTNR